MDTSTSHHFPTPNNSDDTLNDETNRHQTHGRAPKDGRKTIDIDVGETIVEKLHTNTAQDKRCLYNSSLITAVVYCVGNNTQILVEAMS